MNQEVIVEDEGYVRWITLDRADCKNALTIPVVQALTAAFRDAGDARAIAITGRNQAFCSGLDLRAAAENGMDMMQQGEAHLAKFQGLIHAVVTAPQPVLAVVDGPAAGFGCDLALAADVRVVSTRAYFQESFARIGLVPDGGGTWMLPRLVGLAKALEMAMLTERLDAATAKSLGLVAKVVEPEQLMAEGKAIANKLGNGAPLSLQRIKRLMRDSLDRDFPTGFAAEGRAQLECVRSEDCIEGIMAFLQKRAPEFKAR